ncbi:hypothetical protein NB693_21405 [Pantoea ananatis]|nr:hypothetical protein [Pantoea ananatis]
MDSIMKMNACSGIAGLLDQVERQHPLAERRGEEFLGHPAHALGAQREEQHQEPRVALTSAVGTGRMHTKQFQRLGDEVRRDHLDEVHHQDPEEQGDRDRGHQLAGAVVGVLGLAVDELQQDLHERLPLAGHAGGGLARGQPEAEHHQQAHQQRHHQGVDVQLPEPAFLHLESDITENPRRRSLSPMKHLLALALPCALARPARPRRGRRRPLHPARRRDERGQRQHPARQRRDQRQCHFRLAGLQLRRQGVGARRVPPARNWARGIRRAS